MVLKKFISSLNKEHHSGEIVENHGMQEFEFLLMSFVVIV
jgi:hypothetical protein